MANTKDSTRGVTLKSLDDRIVVIIQKLTEIEKRLCEIIELTSKGNQEVVYSSIPNEDELEKVCKTMFPQPTVMQEKVSEIRRKLMEE